MVDTVTDDPHRLGTEDPTPALDQPHALPWVMANASDATDTEMSAMPSRSGKGPPTTDS